ncbi:interleukin-6-like [Pelmatolapia mariae]|uniref:interleukin-6-like n=1 Tax=Pelmatolapia mariae TaxID=158779 RepID=UPI003211D8AB
MPSIFTDVHFFSAVMLAALLLCASGAPIEDGSVAGDFSGEGTEEAEMSTVKPFNIWKSLFDSAQEYEKAFEHHFQTLENRDQALDSHIPASIPKHCNITKFRKEACLQTLAKGLLIYSVLLKHVEKEYRGSLNFSDAPSNIGTLIDLAGMVKGKMKNSNQVTPLTSSEEEQLLKEVNSPDPYHSKLHAYSILRALKAFLSEGKRAVCRMEKRLDQSADTSC